MLKRQAGYTSDKHFDRLRRYAGVWSAAGILSILGLAALALWYGYLWFDAFDQYNAQSHVVDALAAQTPENRRVVAANLLWSYDQGLAPSALQDPVFRTMIDAVRQTGSGGWTTANPASWDPFIHNWVPFWMLSTLALFSLGLGLMYFLDCKSRRHYLADLPWRRPWTWVFVLLAPVLLVPLVVSGIRMLLNPPRAQAHTSQFASDPVGAMAAYREMRVKGTASGQRLYREKVEEELRELQEECAHLADSLRETQQEHLKLKVEHANLHETPDPEPPTDDLLENEFKRLLQLPGVSGIQSSGTDGVALMVAATVEHEAHRYDLGTWKLYLGLSGSVEATELKTGVLATWRGGSPVYRISKKFCFGDHRKLIETHLVRGHILEAAALAVQALHTVNTEHRHRIPQAFKCIGGEST